MLGDTNKAAQVAGSRTTDDNKDESAPLINGKTGNTSDIENDINNNDNNSNSIWSHLSWIHDIFTNTKHNNNGPNPNENNKVLNILHYTFMLFIVTAAGPYGLEALVRSSSPFYAILSLVLVPFLYCLPQSFMCAELSSMIPSNHGSIAWVYRGLGNFCGFLYCTNDILSTMIDIPIYITLIGTYCEDYFDESIILSNSDNTGKEMFHYFFKVFLVILSGLLNVFNIVVVGNTTIVLSIIVMIPFIIGFFWVITEINVSVWFYTSTVESCGDAVGVCNWALWISTVIWLHTGWDIQSNVSGEAGFNWKFIMVPFYIANILDFVFYFIPLIIVFVIAYPASNDYELDTTWSDGYLITAFYDINQVLGIFVFIGALISNYSIHLCEIAGVVREMWAVSQPTAPKSVTKSKIPLNVSQSSLFSGYQANNNSVNNSINNNDNNDGNNNNEEFHMPVGVLPQFIGYIWEKTNVPVVAVLIVTITNCIFVAFSFDFLVELSVTQNCISFVFEYASLIALRYYEPDEPRPYRIPFGMPGVWTVTLLKFGLIIALLIAIIYQEPWVFVACVIFNVIIVIYYYFVVRKNNQTIIDDHMSRSQLQLINSNNNNENESKNDA